MKLLEIAKTYIIEVDDWKKGMEFRKKFHSFTITKKIQTHIDYEISSHSGRFYILIHNTPNKKDIETYLKSVL